MPLNFLRTLKITVIKRVPRLKTTMIWLCCLQKANAGTNMDSDASDDMNDGLVYHLPRRLLNSTCDSSLLDNENKQNSEYK